jgi:hypothetical protein
MLDYKKEIENFDVLNCSNEEIVSKIKTLKNIIFKTIICIAILVMYLIVKIVLFYFELIPINFISILLIDLVLYELFRLYFLQDHIKLYLLIFEAILKNNINE